MIVIKQEQCAGCGTCVEECFLFCIGMKEGKAYFKGEKRCITCGHCMARCPQKAIGTDRYDNGESIEREDLPLMPTPEGLKAMMKMRRSIRHYNKKIPQQSLIKEILDGARFAGTGGNRQALRYIVITEKRDELVKKAAEVFGRLAEQGGFYAPAYSRISRESLKGNDELFYGATAIVLVIGNKRKGFDVRKDGGLATAYIQLLCEAEGLGSCVNGFFGDAFDGCAELRQWLGTREDECLINAVGIGYPDVAYARTVPRKPLDVAWM